MLVRYNDNTINLPEGTSVSDARDALKGIYPEIANADAVETSEGITFEVKAGTKGAGELKVVYGDNSISLPAGTSDADAREALKSIYPEIANADASRDGDTLTFTVKAGTKGV